MSPEKSMFNHTAKVNGKLLYPDKFREKPYNEIGIKYFETSKMGTSTIETKLK